MDLLVGLTIFFGALTFGASGCLIGCMPILSPLVASNATRQVDIKRWLLLLAIGRVTGYIFIAAVSYLSVSYIKAIVFAAPDVSRVFGVFIFLVGAVLAVNIYYPLAHACPVKNISKLPPIAIGVGLSLSFCPALLQLISICAATDSIAAAVIYGVLFGVGVSVVPTLFYGFAVYPLVREGVTVFLRRKKMLELIFAALLMLAGVAIFFQILKV